MNNPWAACSGYFQLQPLRYEPNCELLVQLKQELQAELQSALVTNQRLLKQLKGQTGTALSTKIEEQLAEAPLKVGQAPQLQNRVQEQAQVKNQKCFVDDQSEKFVKMEEEAEQEEQQIFSGRQRPLKSKKDTKNVIKTMIMGICRYIREQKERVTRLLAEKDLQNDSLRFYQFCRRMKVKVTYLSDLRKVWIPDNKEAKYSQFKSCFRILSYEYLRRYFLFHLFDSMRIKEKNIYIKCRKKLMEGMTQPDRLHNLKDY